MGCISSKRATADMPPASRRGGEGRVNIKRANIDASSRSRNQNYNNRQYQNQSQSPSAVLRGTDSNSPPPGKRRKENGDGNYGIVNGNSQLKTKSNVSNSSSLPPPQPSVKNHVGAEQCAAGWPGWLTAVAGEAIHGWVPLRADSFEKLEKIGQGTYSSVFRAREIATGKIVALKKVRFDNFHPESVRFMAREITILRRLDHPNIVKLHGLITSKMSCSIYLVFDYMEHDLSGLISCPDVHFTDSQIKCFMQQLLYGLEYCHKRGVMHRDIKTSNILLNNEGVLKIADFGLANFISTRYRQPLTSRVVTLWYRPPELLLGSTNYGAYVDLWSVGCVFSELLVGKAILKGKTEVEQLHKIFKLCGSSPEDFWSTSKLPHTTMFKPQAPYESSLRERFKGFPETTLKLLQTFLSIEPQNRGTAGSALASEYFTSMPYACEPSSLPMYPPNKELDAKAREEALRRRTMRVKNSTSSRASRRRRGLPEPSSVSMLGRPTDEPQINRKYARRNGTNNLVSHVQMPAELAYDMKSDVSAVSQGESILMGPTTGFVWTNKRKLPPSTDYRDDNELVKNLEEKEVEVYSNEEDKENEEQEKRIRSHDNNNSSKKLEFKHQSDNPMERAYNRYQKSRFQREFVSTRL